ncbi:MAG: NUDIX hydrolase [Treponema sp.]|nr:NUDIX hydrolase [Treponema sp.]
MDFSKIEKIHEGKFITRYDIEYITKSGKKKIYEMVSRKRNVKSLKDLHDSSVDAVVIIMHDKENKRILLNKEFRMAPGEWVINFPAGLIDEGENAQQAAARELKEETGLDLISIQDIWKESYSAVGFSDEKNSVIIGCAEGEFTESNSEIEEIQAAWYTKEEVLKLLKEARFAARTQAYCALWARN